MIGYITRGEIVAMVLGESCVKQSKKHYGHSICLQKNITCIT